MPALTPVPMSPKRRKGLHVPQASVDERQGEAGGSCVPSGKVDEGKALPDLLESEKCQTATFSSFPSW